jgi:site-specific recombinase XerD
MEKLLWFLGNESYCHFSAHELRHFNHYIATAHERPEGRWGNRRLRHKASLRTIEYYFNYVRGFYRWMVAEPTVDVDEDISLGIRVAKPHQEQIEPFTLEQVEALLKSARNSGNARDEALLLFLFDTGCRACEVCSLKHGDLHLQTCGSTATVLGKGRKIRVVHFSRDVTLVLNRYLRRHPRQPHDPVFASLRGGDVLAPLSPSGLLQVFERLGREAGLKGVRCSPHTARHYFAIHFLRNGGNLFALQQMLGHTNLKMTNRYVKLAQTDMANQHQLFSPMHHLLRRKPR